MFNRTILVGNLTRDPELRFTPAGTPIAAFTVAVNSRYKQGDEVKEEVLYMDTTVFGKQAENCKEYLVKGSPVLVEGRLRQSKWNDKETGDTKSRISLLANGVRFLGKKKDGDTVEVEEDAPF